MLSVLRLEKVRVKFVMRLLVILGALSLFTACGQMERQNPNISQNFTNIKIGNPYSVNGKTYYPSHNPTYDKIGIASWYGPGFHGKMTANGEVFDENDITAAHPTLPMPSIVRVTNLSNDKSLVVRINDRGPFHDNRIIDLSKRSAEMLNIKGLETVRVQYLDDETKQYIADVMGGSPKVDMVTFNEDYNTKMREENKILLAKMESASDYSVNEGYFDNNEISNHASLQSVSSKEIDRLDGPVNNGLSAREKKSDVEYIVMAGSYSVEGNATKLVDSLTRHKDSSDMVVLSKVEVDGKNWWRVNVGPFYDKGRANRVLKIVRDEGVGSATIKVR
ncbi:MAG: septal ring lytic transglycosylase RlpA family protein [Rickettsiales bacterium]